MSIPIAIEHAAGARIVVGDRVDVITVVDGIARFVATDLAGDRTCRTAGRRSFCRCLSRDGRGRRGGGAGIGRGHRDRFARGRAIYGSRPGVRGRLSVGPELALAASARDWPDRVHRFLLDHGGGRVLARVMGAEQAVHDEYDVLADRRCLFLPHAATGPSPAGGRPRGRWASIARATGRTPSAGSSSAASPM